MIYIFVHLPETFPVETVDSLYSDEFWQIPLKSESHDFNSEEIVLETAFPRKAIKNTSTQRVISILRRRCCSIERKKLLTG